MGQYNLLFNAGLLVKTGACLALCYDGLVNVEAGRGLVFRPLTPTVIDSNTLVWNKNYHLPNVAQLFIKEMRALINDKNY